MDFDFPTLVLIGENNAPNIIKHITKCITTTTSEQGQQSTEVKYIDPKFNVEKHENYINKLKAEIASIYKLNEDLLKTQTYTSGYQLALSKQDLLNAAKEKREFYKPSIRKLVKLIIKQHNKLINNGFKNGVVLPEDKNIIVDFNEYQIVQSPFEMAQTKVIQLANNLKSRVDLQMESNPDLTREQAEEKVKQIIKDNEEYTDTSSTNQLNEIVSGVTVQEGIDDREI